MNRKLALTGVLVAGLLAAGPASAHDFHHHHGGGPVFGLVRAAVDIATLPVRVVGGAVSAATYYPAPGPYYAQPVYYAAPPVYYAYPPQAYAYPPQQPVYAYPQPGYNYGQ